MENKRIEDADFSQTGYSYTLSLIAGKYKPVILYCLMEYEPVRFNQMQRYLGKIADKTLSATLKELERDGLIHREMYPEIPPKVEYTRYRQELCANSSASLMKLVRRRPNRPQACSAWLPICGPSVVRQGWRSHLRSP